MSVNRTVIVILLFTLSLFIEAKERNHSSCFNGDFSYNPNVISRSLAVNSTLAEYPTISARDGAQGCIALSFTLAANGNPEDIKFEKASGNTEELQKNIKSHFFRTSKRSLKKWTFSELIAKEVRLNNERMLFVFIFNLKGYEQNFYLSTPDEEHMFLFTNDSYWRSVNHLEIFPDSKNRSIIMKNMAKLQSKI